MTDLQNDRGWFSRYGANLINYMREEHLDDGELGDIEWVDFIRDIGQAQVLANVPEPLQKFFTEEYQAKVQEWAGPNVDLSPWPTDDEPVPAAEAPAAEAPAEEAPAETEEPADA